MWLVQRIYDGGEPCGSYEEAFFVTADRELAQTTVDLLNENLLLVRELMKSRPEFPRDKLVKGNLPPEVLTEYRAACERHHAQVDALIKEYDPEGHADISEYTVEPIEVR
jgi:hypothetical protein